MLHKRDMGPSSFRLLGVLVLATSFIACGDSKGPGPGPGDGDGDSDSVVCGNGLVDGDEACDGAALAGATCVTQGFDDGTLACAAGCGAFDTSNCYIFSCGNGFIEGLEVCDNTELAGATCASRGFLGGTLACSENCLSFDTSSCFLFECGNDLHQGDEPCDGVDLDGATCITRGFDAGTLACASDCSSFDESGCRMFACGNDILEASELCDVSQLSGATCVSQGLDGGTLVCAVDCSAYDTSGCYVCGDAIQEGPEVCDGPALAGGDCVNQGFQGGTLACASDCSAYDLSGCYTCGDSVISGPETCDGPALGAATCLTQGFDGGTLGCLGNCTSFDTSACTTCGDGTREPGEACEGADLNGATCVSQGFDFGALGCTATCTYREVHCVDVVLESEPNDDGAVAVGVSDFFPANANGPYSADALIAGSINPAGDDDVFAITNPGTTYLFLSVETYGPTAGNCDLATDTVVFILDGAGAQLATNDQSGIANCSLVSDFVLAPGVTVYARVIDFQDNSAIPSYHVNVRFDPIICGNGSGEVGEQCDDGNNANGDGCSATCTIEGAVAEVEPNATTAQADTSPVVITGSTRITGAIGALADVDTYRMVLSAAQTIRFETFSALRQCNGISTTLGLFDSTGTQIVADPGAVSGSGIASCAALVLTLPAGVYYVRVEETGNNATLTGYVLDVAMLALGATESEPNETFQAATNVLTPGASDFFISGDHALTTDSDFYGFQVLVAGTSLRIELVEGDRTVETCESMGIDSRITLYDSAGVLLVDDDDTGRGFCSLIDGTGLGTTPLDPEAHNLAPGFYYVQVRAADEAGPVGGTQFTYKLVVTQRRP